MENKNLTIECDLTNYNFIIIPKESSNESFSAFVMEKVFERAGHEYYNLFLNGYEEACINKYIMPKKKFGPGWKDEIMTKYMRPRNIPDEQFDLVFYVNHIESNFAASKIIRRELFGDIPELLTFKKNVVDVVFNEKQKAELYLSKIKWSSIPQRSMKYRGFLMDLFGNQVLVPDPWCGKPLKDLIFSTLRSGMLAVSEKIYEEVCMARTSADVYFSFAKNNRIVIGVKGGSNDKVVGALIDISKYIVEDTFSGVGLKDIGVSIEKQACGNNKYN